jgi:hypothetical protein
MAGTAPTEAQFTKTFDAGPVHCSEWLCSPPAAESTERPKDERKWRQDDGVNEEKACQTDSTDHDAADRVGQHSGNQQGRKNPLQHVNVRIAEEYPFAIRQLIDQKASGDDVATSCPRKRKPKVWSMTKAVLRLHNGSTFNGRHRADRLSVYQNSQSGAGPLQRLVMRR